MAKTKKAKTPKYKKKRSRAPRLKRLGFGGSYPIRAGRMGGGGPYFITALPQEQKAPQEQRAPSKTEELLQTLIETQKGAKVVEGTAHSISKTAGYALATGVAVKGGFEGAAAASRAAKQWWDPAAFAEKEAEKETETSARRYMGQAKGLWNVIADYMPDVPKEGAFGSLLRPLYPDPTDYDPIILPGQQTTPRQVPTSVPTLSKIMHPTPAPISNPVATSKPIPLPVPSKPQQQTPATSFINASDVHAFDRPGPYTKVWVPKERQKGTTGPMKMMQGYSYVRSSVGSAVDAFPTFLSGS